MAGRLDGMVILITGASSGIGAATARLVAKQGALPVLSGRRAERLEALAKELPGALAVQADMRDPEQARQLVERTLEHHGRVDVLINNAGQGLHLPLEQVSLEDLVAITELNFYAPLLAMQTVLPGMRSQGGGKIVNISSGTSRTVLPGVGAYAATKAALNMLSLVAREELAAEGIVVSIVYPSVTATEFHDTLRAGSMPLGSSGLVPHSPEYVAKAIIRALHTGEAEVVIPHGPERYEEMELGDPQA
ncbi:MAG: SDR family NAD(P)-dependent oxidoreductase [Actinomycetota bacterium]|nr:SDR family NAD(P)-dependent oxidoreductase [Actinomycetota bacterium]